MSCSYLNYKERWDEIMLELEMKDLETVLREFKESVCDGIHGVVCIDSEKPGPVLGITACTHGNEPSGLAIFHHLLNDVNIREKLQCGTLYLVVNNIRAAEKFFVCKTEEEKRDCRGIDMNMNRLPRDVMSSKDARYELIRARELYPIWQRFTHGLDIHSMTVDIPPMLISRGNNFDRIVGLIQGFSIEILLSNIDAVQIGAPVFAFYGADGDVPVFAIEAGQHVKSETLGRAESCAVSLLQNLGMYPGIPETVDIAYREYEIVDSIIFPNKSFDFIKQFEPFSSIKMGDLLAESSNGARRQSGFDGHLIFPTKDRGEGKDISEEVSFISLPMKVRKIE